MAFRTVYSHVGTRMGICPLVIVITIVCREVTSVQEIIMPMSDFLSITSRKRPPNHGFRQPRSMLRGASRDERSPPTTRSPFISQALGCFSLRRSSPCRVWFGT
jgi:hypothetical protein